jgi:hypothetical protein
MEPDPPPWFQDPSATAQMGKNVRSIVACSSRIEQELATLNPRWH